MNYNDYEAREYGQAGIGLIHPDHRQEDGESPDPNQRVFVGPDFDELAREEREFNRVLTRIQRESAEASVAQMATALKDLLSSKLTAYMVGVESERSIQRWATCAVKDIGYESMLRLRTAYELVLLLTEYRSEQFAKGWFVGVKPQLDFITPVEAIRSNQLRDVIGAARAALTGA